MWLETGGEGGEVHLTRTHDRGGGGEVHLTRTHLGAHYGIERAARQSYVYRQEVKDNDKTLRFQIVTKK